MEKKSLLQSGDFNPLEKKYLVCFVNINKMNEYCNKLIEALSLLGCS